MQDVIALLSTQRAELLDSIARIDAAIAALGGEPGRSAAKSAPAGRRRRPMSEDAKKAASERMKNYWAERRKQAAAAEGQPQNEGT